MEQTSLLGDSEPSINKQCLICCKPIYRIRKLKNKGAIAILVWNFFLVSVLNYLAAFIVPNGLQTITVALGVTIPFAGWLADLCVGRYKMIHWSMWIMWIASILATINSVVAEFVSGHQGVHRDVSLLIMVILAIVFGEYQANVIQFGLDQLQDPSTTEITAFITWYVWTYFSNGVFFDLPTYALNQNTILLDN